LRRYVNKEDSTGPCNSFDPRWNPGASEMSFRNKLQMLFQGIWKPRVIHSNPTRPVPYGVVTDAIPICPVCNLPSPQHEYQQIASVPFKEGNEENLKALEEAFRLHDWRRLSDFQEWEGARNNADVILLKCPDGRFNLTMIYDPIDLDENSLVLRQHEIKADDLPTLGGEWKRVMSIQ
jgi:hypothetical protein